MVRRSAVALLTLMETGKNLAFRKLIVLMTRVVTGSRLRNPTGALANCGSGQPQSVAIACKFMPYLSVKFPAPLQASSPVCWVKSQKVAKFHGHTLWVPKIRLAEICAMNGQLIQEVARWLSWTTSGCLASSWFRRARKNKSSARINSSRVQSGFFGITIDRSGREKCSLQPNTHT
jgi:hypothetical protein